MTDKIVLSFVTDISILSEISWHLSLVLVNGVVPCAELSSYVGESGR